MKHYYLFDMDGTLVDSMDAWSSAMIKILEEEQIPQPDGLIRTITPLGYHGSADLYIHQLGLQDTHDHLVSRMLSHAVYEYTYNVAAKAGVADYIRQLKANGCHCSVLTASPHETTDVCLKRNGLFDLFDNVWSSDDFGLPKNGPEIYFRAAEKMGCTIDDLVFFDDNLLALTAAKEAGVEIIGVHDKFSNKDREEIISICDRYIESFEELLEQ